MKIRQQLKQKQHLNQQLQQSLKILELQLLELRNKIEEELDNNPVLEEITVKKEEGATQQTTSSAEADEPEASLPYPEKKTPTEKDWPGAKSIPDKKENLQDFLLKQLYIATNQKQLKIGSAIINSLDENGYLKIPLNEIAQLSGCSTKEAEEALKIIKSLEPVGVGAADLMECLLIQLQRLKKPHPLSFEIVRNHLHDLANKDYTKITKKLKASAESITAAIQQIIHLEPKPGRSFSTEQISYIIPDAIIEEKNGEFSITISDERLPNIFINPKYKRMLNDKKIDEATKEFIRQKLINARNLIQAVRQRHTTIYKVIESILATQKEALTEGMEKLNPLTLKNIAGQVGLHASTISRVVTNKYIQTPYGIFALKDFFSAGVASEKGKGISSKKIKLRVQALVEEENKNKPLSDKEISDIIQSEEKIKIARRTIAKYREQIKILPKSKRRIK